MKLISKIKGPEDVKKMNIYKLTELAEEIRDFLIQKVSKTGGHLASNLGVVELSIALHKVFDSPKDKLIWDVGHQSYVHKILTGRWDRFDSLRQYNGLSGFPKRKESPHDHFETGHSSTSISAAVGFATARDLLKQKYSVVAIIGDGAMTGGMAFEALNYAGEIKSDLTVVLNDNEMSISNNVGGLSEYLNSLRTDPKYARIKNDIEFLLNHIPAIGKRVSKTVERVKDSLKYLLVPGMLFEELGFTYLGPVNGHNLNALIKILTMAKKTKGPVLVHVLTKKGKGYLHAEKNPDKFHGIGPFDIKTGQTFKKPVPTYSEVFGRTLTELAKEDDRIVAITAAMSSGTGLNVFKQNFPDRFFDVGIAEQHAVTMAAGLANQGFKPVVALYSTFLQRAYDQVIHDVCMQNLHVIFAVDRAGLVGNDGETHHGAFDYSFLRPIPNMVLMAPKDEQEMRNMLKTAVNYNGPISLRYPRGSGWGSAITPPEEIPIGKAEVLTEGDDLLILAIGSMVKPSLDAAEILKAHKIHPTVVNCRFVKPLDEQLILNYSKRIKNIITVEENVLAGGFGCAVMECLEKNGISNVRIKRIGLPDRFIPHGSHDILLKENGLTAENIFKTAKSFLDK